MTLIAEIIVPLFVGLIMLAALMAIFASGLLPLALSVIVLWVAGATALKIVGLWRDG